VPLMPHDVFISHSSDDAAVAGEACVPPEEPAPVLDRAVGNPACAFAERRHRGGTRRMLWSDSGGQSDPSFISLSLHCGCDSE
jgi:hypothetical protein